MPLRPHIRPDAVRNAAQLPNFQNVSGEIVGNEASVMMQLLKSLIELCELSIRIHPTVWQASAKGPLAVIALVALAAALLHHAH